jgi:hypothetical protein
MSAAAMTAAEEEAGGGTDKKGVDIQKILQRISDAGIIPPEEFEYLKSAVSQKRDKTPVKEIKSPAEEALKRLNEKYLSLREKYYGKVE